MSLLTEIQERSENKCELCSATANLSVYEVQPPMNRGAYGNINACAACLEQIEDPEKMDANHWHCLNDSMWSEHDAVKVMAWRMLARQKSQDLMDMIYFEGDAKAWAEATGEGDDDAVKIVHKDSNGVTLQSGDSVVLIKDLPVKGSSMIAKRGTAVRRISLDHENAEYIEGKVDGQQIVIITKYVKKT
jgi:protein PhnA